jgi:hypothetical protein
MDELDGFKDVAPYLTQPLVLVGFVLLLAFGVHRALLKAGIIPPLTPSSGSKVVQGLLRYGFVIAILAIILGFSLEFYRTPRSPISASGPMIEQAASVAKGGTAINAGRDVSEGVQPARAPNSTSKAASPSEGDKEAPPVSINQDARAEGGGSAINAGRDVNIKK